MVQVIDENKARENVGVPRVRAGNTIMMSHFTRHTSHVTRHTSHVNAGKRPTASERALVQEEKKTEFDELFDES